MAGDCRKILERATIRFPRPIGLEETEELIDYLCRNIPGRANYRAGYHKTVGQSFEDEGEFYNQRGTVDLAGMISRSDGSAFDGFNCVISGGQDTSMFEALAFQTIPGYNHESEYRPEVLELWDGVRIRVGDYFNQRQQKDISSLK